MRNAISIWTVTVCIQLLACGGHHAPRRFPITEDARNAIEIEFRSAAGADVVPIIARVCADLPIPTSQIDQSRGCVETRWVDSADYETLNTAAYPLRERQVAFVFQTNKATQGARRVLISAVYQPNRPPGSAPGSDKRYDRLVPVQHPAYQLALQLEYQLRRAMERAGIVFVDGEKAE